MYLAKALYMSERKPKLKIITYNLEGHTLLEL